MTAEPLTPAELEAMREDVELGSELTRAEVARLLATAIAASAAAPNPATCGFRAFCGRKRPHRGHHGGWRTGVRRVVSIIPPALTEQLGEELTPRQLEVVAEVLVHGDNQAVATCLGLSILTVKQHLNGALSKTGADSTRQLPLLLGWATIPPAYLPRHRLEVAG